VRVLVAPQSYKGSLDALEVAEAIVRGLREAWPDHEYDVVPVADGGEGTVEALVNATKGTYRETVVEDPLGRPVRARWGMLGDSATSVIEMAAASGLPLLQRSERNPMITSTFGTGQLIKAALDAGAERLIVGIGGSATNDAGAGMAFALGARFLDDQGRILTRGGRALNRLARIDLTRFDARLKTVDVVVASDVTNPLTGADGASRVYGPQKGATPQGIEVLDRALIRFGAIVERDLGVDVSGIPGAGAAGGLGAGLIAFAGARIRRGVDLIFEAMRFDDHLDHADIVFTGEGRIDEQDVFGKAPIVVAQRAALRKLPVIVIVGSIGHGYEACYDHGVSAVLSIMNRPMTIEKAVQNTAGLIADAAVGAARLIEVGRGLAAEQAEPPVASGPNGGLFNTEGTEQRG
jgi:glycerate kinase